jgi:hypothetical protein
VLRRTPQGGATPIEIDIDIEIGKLPEIDFDHDFDFDFDTEQPRFENKNALSEEKMALAFRQKVGMNASFTGCGSAW